MKIWGSNVLQQLIDCAQFEFQHPFTFFVYYTFGKHQSSVVQNEQRILIPVELKAVEADEKNIIQIQRYIDWIEQYYIPNRQSDIQPVLVAKKITDKQSNTYQRLVDSFNRFNQANNNRCARLKFIEFDLDNDDLSFEIVLY